MLNSIFELKEAEKKLIKENKSFLATQTNAIALLADFLTYESATENITFTFSLEDASFNEFLNALEEFASRWKIAFDRRLYLETLVRHPKYNWDSSHGSCGFIVRGQVGNKDYLDRK